MTFHEGVEFAGRTIEAIGVAIILVGTLVVLVIYALAALRRDRSLADEYAKGRRGIGKVLLLGLEVLVAGDIVRTVAVQPTLSAVLSLGVVVIIRTFLSWSIELETEGRWPWQQSGAG